MPIPEEILGTYYYNSMVPEKPSETFCSLIELSAIFEDEKAFTDRQHTRIHELRVQNEKALNKETLPADKKNGGMQLEEASLRI